MTGDRILFWNLGEAGIEWRHGDPTRWHAQCDLVAALAPQVLMTVENWDWDHADHLLFHETCRVLGMTGRLFPARTGCHQAVLWRPGVTLVAVDDRPRDLATWHGFGSVVLRPPGRGDPVRFVVAHLDPFSPVNRWIESDRLRGFVAEGGGVPVVLAMDANTTPPGDPEPDWSALAPGRRENHVWPGTEVSDRTPVQRLLGAAHAPLLVDVAAHLGVRTPTVGHDPAGTHPPRRIDLFLVSPSLLADIGDYQVVGQADERLVASDHLPLVITLGPRGISPRDAVRRAGGRDRPVS